MDVSRWMLNLHDSESIKLALGSALMHWYNLPTGILGSRYLAS